MNKAILIGNLANDPEFRTTASGIAKCTFRLAVQRRFTNQQGERETDFLTIVCWRQTAELCNRYLSKGRKVAVEGSVQTRSYEAQDGSKRYVTEIVADNVEFLGSRGEASQQGGAYSPPPFEDAPHAPARAAAPAGDFPAQRAPMGSEPPAKGAPAPRQKAPAGAEPVTMEDDELPF